MFGMGGSITGVDNLCISRLSVENQEYCVRHDGERSSWACRWSALIKPNLFEPSQYLGGCVAGRGGGRVWFTGRPEQGALRLAATVRFAGRRYRVYSPRVTVRGFTGAGDTVLAVFIYRRFIKGDGCYEALRRANAAAAIKVQLPSTEMPTKEMLNGII